MKNEALDRVVSDDPSIIEFCNSFDDIAVQYIDQSVKIQSGSVNSERVLLYIPSHRISWNRLHDILIKFNFPEEYRFELTNNYYASVNIGICLEKSGTKTNYRVYTEYRVDETSYLKMVRNLVQKHKIIDSFKWDYDNPSGVKKTFYETLILPNVSQIELAMYQYQISYVPETITKKLHSKEGELFGTYCVHDNITDRKGLDIKFHDPFVLGDLAEDLSKFSKKNIQNLLKPLDIYPIHRVSLGIDANEKDYVTLYFKL